MRRALVICLAASATLAAAIFAAALFLFNTGPGRAFIIAQLEPEIGDALGGEATIGALKGALPGRPVLENVVLSDAGGPWLTIERIEMDWRPLRLLRDEIDIARLRIAGAHLLREPPDDDSPDEDRKDDRLSLRLPDDLPALAIADLSLENFRSDLGGAPARLDGVGAVDMGGRRISATLRLTSENDRDLVDITVERAPRAGRFFIDATVAGAEDGVIAAFADLDGPVFLEIKSDGPARQAVVAVDGAIGAYGEIHMRFAGDIENLTALDLAGDFAPGPALSHVTELSRPVAFDMRLEEKRRGGVLRIAELTSALGALQGTLEWTNSRAITNDVAADLKAVFAEDYRPEMQTVIGDAAALTAVVRRRDARYAFEATLESDRVSAVVVDGSTDFDKLFAGDLTATFKPREDFFLLDAPASVVARVDLDLDATAQFPALTVTREDGTSVGGEASYRFEDDAIRFNGDVSAAPALVSALIPSLTPSDFIEAAVEFSGPPDRFTLKADIDAPAIDIGDNQAPPLDIAIALAGLPDLPTGDIVARAKSGAGRFEATLRSSQDGRIALPRLTYRGEGFALNGDGAFHPQRDILELDLSYDGEAGATPWPGAALEGALQVKGTISRKNAATAMTVKADAIRLNDIAAAGLKISAEGPPNAVKTTLNAAHLTIPGIGAVDDLAVTARADLRGGPDLALSALSGVAVDNTFSLRQPATISFTDGIVVDGLRLNWGRQGAIVFDGAFSDTRWRAAIKLTDANVPGADGRVTLDLDLDTDKQTPARGSFVLRSLLTQKQEASIAGEFIWDGETVILSSIEAADAIDMRIALPVRLTRTPGLGVETDGALDGYARYDGQIAVIAAYLPPVLQTLEGSLKADIRFAGAASAPDISGAAAIADGAYTELQSGFSLTGLHTEANASYRGGQSVIRFSGGARGAGQTGKDSITLTGEMTLGETSNLALAVGFDRAELSAHPVDRLRASGRIDIHGPLDAIAAEGELIIDELDAEIVTPEDTGLAPITVVAYDDASGAAESVDDIRPAATIDYDIHVSADDRIFVRGRGLESEWSADIKAVNDGGAALILGQMTLRRGWLDFSGRRFTLTRGSIAFDRLSPNNPRLDIRAEHETGDGVTAIIAVTGRAETPSIELTSTPSLPSEDVMALVLFGKPAKELTAIESLQTAQALASLSGVGPFGGGGVAGTLRQAVGLDLLNFDIDPQNGGGSLTLGKYVADGLFVSATQDARGESGAVRIEYEITDNITVETEIEQNGDQTVSANWKRDF